MSLAQLFGGLSPLFVALTAVVPSKFVVAAVFGGALGCLSTAPAISAVQSIAAAAAAATINCTVYKLAPIREFRLFAPLSALLCTAVTGITALTASGFTINGAITYFGAALLAGCAAYFIGDAIRIRPLPSGNFCLGAKELSGLAVTGCTLFMALGSVEIKGLVPARALAAIVILMFAKYGKETGGSIAGVCIGVSLALATGNHSSAGTFALGGLLAGVFASLSSLASASVLVVICGLAVLIFGESPDIATFIEVVFGSVIFLAMPQKAVDWLRTLFIIPQTAVSIEPARAAVTIRLQTASDTIARVSEYIESMSEEFNRSHVEPVELIPEEVRTSVCAACAKHRFCHVENAETVQAVFLGIMNDLTANVVVTVDRLSPAFICECLCPDELTAEFNRAYARHISHLEATEKTAQIRAVVTDQFDSMSDVLRELSDEVAGVGKYSAKLARKASAAIEATGARVNAASCCTDENGHMKLAVQAVALDENAAPFQLSKAVSKACEIKFSEPSIMPNGDGTLITMTQSPLLELEIGAAQSTARNGKYCGDCFTCFDNGRGQSLMILSDGMGTGGRAAVDSALTLEIFSDTIRAGIGFENAVKLVNSALLVKGEYESLATLDVLSVDLYSGKSIFMKAGGTATLVRKRNRVMRLELPALPVGILRNVRLESTEAMLSPGDVVLMFSDGLDITDGGWVERELENYKNTDPQKFAEHIVKLAKEETEEEHQDDITVLCAIVKRAGSGCAVADTAQARKSS